MSERVLQLVFVAAVLAWLASVWIALGAAASGALGSSFAGELGLAAWLVLFAPLIAVAIALFGGIFGLTRSLRIAAPAFGLALQLFLMLLARIV